MADARNLRYVVSGLPGAVLNVTVVESRGFRVRKWIALKVLARIAFLLGCEYVEHKEDGNVKTEACFSNHA